MCNVCCKVLKGWCSSFTRTELALALLQALLLAALVGFLCFLTLHLLVCSQERANLDREPEHVTDSTPSGDWKLTSDNQLLPTVSTDDDKVVEKPSTLSPDVECTWQPSTKTEATTHYYWTPGGTHTSDAQTVQTKHTTGLTDSTLVEYDEYDYDAGSDGREAPQIYKNYVAALVKLNPPADLSLGCILTKVTPYWTLTAASCIEAIEEVDSLDSFYITNTFGEAQQSASHELSDVQMHPLYQGTNSSYDLAAVRSATALAPPAAPLLRLPAMLDYLLLGLGERLTILGYGGYRSGAASATGRRLRRAGTFVLARGACGAWAPRHLAAGGAARAGRCGGAALCAGALRGRGGGGGACGYCAGTPLLRGAALLGVMADRGACALACEPALYVNLAALRDWLDSVLD